MYIRNAQALTLRGDRLKIRNPATKEERYMYCDELSVLVLENSRATVRVDAVNALLRAGATILVCNEKRAPAALVSNEFGYYNKLRVLKLQMALGKKAKNRLWQKVVRQKIENQLRALPVASESAIAGFRAYAAEVEEGDSTGREAAAARGYFPLCFGKGFRRGRHGDIINASLNYGYAVLRAVIRKSLVTHGFEPSMGFHHDSAENPFNLSDDVIEPYRPFADMAVMRHIAGGGADELDLDMRLLLLEKTLMSACIVGGKSYVLHDAVEATVVSLLVCYENNSSSGSA